MIWIMKNHDPDQKNALFFMIRIQKQFPLFFDPNLFFYLAQKMYFCIPIHEAKKSKKIVLRLKPGQIQ